MNNGVIIGILIVAVIAIVGYLAYAQGVFDGAETEEGGLEIQLGGTTSQ